MMIKFIELKRNEGKIQRHEWVNVDAIDTFARLDNDTQTMILLRSGARIYVAENVPDILRLLTSIGDVDLHG